MWLSPNYFDRFRGGLNRDSTACSWCAAQPTLTPAFCSSFFCAVGSVARIISVSVGHIDREETSFHQGELEQIGVLHATHSLICPVVGQKLPFPPHKPTLVPNTPMKSPTISRVFGSAGWSPSVASSSSCEPLALCCPRPVSSPFVVLQLRLQHLLPRRSFVATATTISCPTLTTWG